MGVLLQCLWVAGVVTFAAFTALCLALALA